MVASNLGLALAKDVCAARNCLLGRMRVEPWICGALDGWRSLISLISAGATSALELWPVCRQSQSGARSLKALLGQNSQTRQAHRSPSQRADGSGRKALNRPGAIHATCGGEGEPGARRALICLVATVGQCWGGGIGSRTSGPARKPNTLGSAQSIRAPVSSRACRRPTALLCVDNAL